MNEQQAGGTVDDGGRCPSCGARVAAAQPWCTLCHARLDRGGAGAEVADPHPGEPLGAARHSTDPISPVDPAQHGLGAAVPAAARPDPVAGTPTPLPPGAAEAMLAELAATTAGERPLSRGPLAGRSRAVRTALAVGAALVLTAVGVGLLTLVGLLL